VEVLELAETVAPTSSTILISGESGTGKEVVARYIHELSERSENAFMSINCGALPESLLESELFGHVKGSFTGAVRDKDGLLVAAAGGTFFLDEIAEMSPSTQVKLLRAIQEREVIPVGSTKRSPSTCGSSRRPTATSRKRSARRVPERPLLQAQRDPAAPAAPAGAREDVPVLARYFLARLNGRRAGGGGVQAGGRYDGSAGALRLAGQRA
jgi:MoxR-like ATPase